MPLGHDPPFADVDNLYKTIDVIQLGHVPWESLTVMYQPKEGEDTNDVAWKQKSYKVWYCNPCEVLKIQLSNCDFENEMDFTVKKIVDSKTQVQHYQDYMSAQDQKNIGTTFCPIILGSDKTTVSIATGQNEYYPLYMSNRLIHNNVCCVHRNGVSLIAFMAIPKTDKEHEDSEGFRHFRQQLFHASIHHILQTLRLGMEEPEVLHYADGYYQKTLFGLGAYIADYPKQVLLSCVIQDWCP
ncbi:hypothetical protein APHAL10511_005039, partial [Amanita phalloides]